MENAYKILDIIKELKSNHIGCYYDRICDVFERKYGFENSAADTYLDFCVNNGFITPANSRGKISYRLVALPDIYVDGEDSLTLTIIENLQLVTPGSATSNSSFSEGGRRQVSNFSVRTILITLDNSGKNSNELLFKLNQGMDVNLNVERNVDAKNLLSF